MRTLSRGLRPAVLSVLTSAWLALGAAGPAGAGELEDSMELGVDYMISIQGTYPGTIRVNPGPPGDVVPSPGTPNVWEWQVGSGLAYSNTWGASALGVLAAAGQLQDGAGGASAAAYALDLVGNFADEGLFERSETLPFGTDVELLARMGGGPPGCRSVRPEPALRERNRFRNEFARTASAWLANYESGSAAADRIIDGRTAGSSGDLAGWDVALVIRGALAAGDSAFACEAAERLYERESDWKGSSPAYLQDWWGGPSEAGVAYALSLLDAEGSCGDWSAEVRELRDALHARQAESDGGPFTGVDAYGALAASFNGFPFPATQLTSFGVLGLLGCGRDTTPEDLAVASRALGFLVRAQYPEGAGPVVAGDPRPADGGWAAYPTFWYDDSNGEINGEALLALALGARLGVEPAPLPPAPSALTSGGSWSGSGERVWTSPVLDRPSERAPLVGPADGSSLRRGAELLRGEPARRAGRR